MCAGGLGFGLLKQGTQSTCWPSEPFLAVLTVLVWLRTRSELIGALGGKLHTGRSRNDQVCICGHAAIVLMPPGRALEVGHFEPG